MGRGVGVAHRGSRPSLSRGLRSKGARPRGRASGQGQRPAPVQSRKEAPQQGPQGRWEEPPASAPGRPEDPEARGSAGRTAPISAGQILRAAAKLASSTTGREPRSARVTGPPSERPSQQGEGTAARHPTARTRSELRGFVLALRAELLTRDQTLVLCLKAALTWEEEGRPVRSTS